MEYLIYMPVLPSVWQDEHLSGLNDAEEILIIVVCYRSGT